MVTPEVRARFLRNLRDTGNVSVSARAVGVSPGHMRVLRTREPDFDADWAEAEMEAADALEEEARRRAVKGTAKGIYHKGALVARERQYSDQLLIRLLEANKPDKFANRNKTEVTNPDGSFAAMDETSLAAKLSSLLAIAQQRKDESET